MKKTLDKSINSKGAPYFKKMLEEKRMINEHIRKGGDITELGDFTVIHVPFVKENWWSRNLRIFNGLRNKIRSVLRKLQQFVRKLS